MSERSTIEVIIVEPMREPKLIQLEDDLKVMQQAVGQLLDMKIAEYVREQLQEDIASNQISLKEYIDPFTGEKVKK